MKSYPLQVRISTKVLADIDNLAGAANLDRAEYIKLWLGAIARLKRENAVRALATIPQEMFKGLAGRPTDEDAAAKE